MQLVSEKKMNVALEAGVISFDEHVSRLREFYSARSYRDMLNGFEPAADGFFGEDEWWALESYGDYISEEMTYEYVGELERDVAVDYFDILEYPHRERKSLEWKTRALFLAAKSSGFFDTNSYSLARDLDDSGEEIYVREENAYFFLGRSG